MKNAKVIVTTTAAIDLTAFMFSRIPTLIDPNVYFIGIHNSLLYGMRIFVLETFRKNTLNSLNGKACYDYAFIFIR